MKILVIGAAGRTGRHLVEHAAGRGHTVTTLARAPHDLSRVPGAHAVVSGDATDPDTVRAALDEQDAVIAAVGTSAITRILLTAMSDAGVRRVVMPSSRSVVATRPRIVLALVWLRFRAAYADLARAEGMLETSGLDWSIVRATMLTDGPFTGRVHTDFAADATGGDWRLSRADYAMALLDTVEDNAMIRRSVGVAGARTARHVSAATQPR
ncbi:MAG: NAD(P)H-binding protein [Intrasporangium sp.]|uniref:NAD(P)-dependent oxidoreductase n=1 Tax=Intrasporangium sp. TaxID=1925024 RepID=UPI0026487E16|nr:NAD(P)H-binding protein [Intrasporangium sp.]MDN5795634.1 NAD(P)H-binding protein [Intrasporangium sp.]